MSDGDRPRYYLGATQDMRHVVTDRETRTQIAFCRTPAYAGQIVKALNRADRRDKILRELNEGVVPDGLIGRPDETAYAVPSRSQVEADLNATLPPVERPVRPYPSRFIDQGDGKLHPLDEETRHPYELADEKLSRRISTQADQLVEIRKYLAKLNGYLIRRCEEVDGDPTDIPEVPWNVT